MALGFQVLNQRYTAREVWALRHSIARALTPRRAANAARALGWIPAGPAEPDPLLLLVEPSSRCNLACRFCPAFPGTGGPKGEMDVARYRRLLDEMADSLLFVCLWFYGEPLLHPELASLVAYAHRKNLLVALSTNGTGLTEERSGELLDAGLDWLFVSLDGPSEVEHDLNRGPGSFRAAVANTRRFVQMRDARGQVTPLVELKPILHRANEGRIYEMRGLARDLGVDRVTFQLLTLQHDAELRAHLPRDPDLVLRAPSTGARGCRRIHTSAVVGWDGTVLPCCEDFARSVPLGNVDTAGFRAVWRGAAYRELRAALSGRGPVPSICRTCHISDYDIVNLTWPVPRP